jgi:hypothetical protein
VIYKKSIIDSLEAIKRGEEYGMLSVANKKKLQMSKVVKDGFAFDKSALDESRKRFMMALPKVRFNHLQDVVVRIAFSDK